MNIIKELRKLDHEIRYLVEHPISPYKHKSGSKYRWDGRTFTKPNLKSNIARKKRKIKRNMAKISRRINRK